MAQDVTLISDGTIVPVKNLMAYRVAYVLDSGVHRRFAPYSTIKVTAGELRQLSYQPGGTELLTNYLRVCNKDLAHEFGVTDDMVEYNWDEKDIVNALTTAPIDVLLDALDFAPDGIRDMIVDKAVDLEIPDINKRDAIKSSTGYDITKMIETKHAYDDVETEEAPAPAAQRRSTSSDKTAKSQRRTASK